MDEATCTSLLLPLFDNAATLRRWGGNPSSPANDLQSHQPPNRPTGQAGRRPGHLTQRRMANLLIVSEASNRSTLSAVSTPYPFRESIMETRHTRTRTRIRFNNPFFDYCLTCLVSYITNISLFSVLHLLFLANR